MSNQGSRWNFQHASGNQMKTIDIQAGDDLAKLEEGIARLNAEPVGAEFTIRLARNLNAHFFKQSRVAAFFATAAQRGLVRLRDWHHTWTPDDFKTVYRSSVGHLASAVYAREISNEHGVRPPFAGGDVTAAVAHDGGILEPHNPASREFSGTSLSFCSIDPGFSEPLALAGLIYNKKQFVDELTSIKRRDLDRDRSHATMDLFAEDSPDRELAGYVFELYQNGYEHGNRSRADKKQVIPGLRFISLRKHIAPNFAHLHAYADGFPELGDYLRKQHERHQVLKYYEVAVSDQGLGMLDRFLIDRPDYLSEAGSRGARLHLLKRLLTETLTSKKGAPGAGGGLIRALRAARELNGFVSIRTGEFWIHCSYAEAGSLPMELTEVTGATPAPVAGTHFNALFPLRR